MLSASRMAPPLMRAIRRKASGSASRPSASRICASLPAISSSLRRRKRKCWVRERIVAGMRSGSVVAKMKITCSGGSSSVLSRALKALFDIMCASSRMMTFFGLSSGASRMRSRNSRTSSTELLLAASISITSGCRSSRTMRQFSHSPQGRSSGAAWQPTLMAMRRAVVVLPTPRGPENR